MTSALSTTPLFSRLSMTSRSDASVRADGADEWPRRQWRPSPGRLRGTVVWRGCGSHAPSPAATKLYGGHGPVRTKCRTRATACSRRARRAAARNARAIGEVTRKAASTSGGSVAPSGASRRTAVARQPDSAANARQQPSALPTSSLLRRHARVSSRRERRCRSPRARARLLRAAP